MDTDRAGATPEEVLAGLADAIRWPDVPVVLSPLLMAAHQIISQLATPSPAASGDWQDGYRAGLEAAAKVAETYQRDASFDDSQVGAIEHNANQANIAAAIRAIPAPSSPWQPIATAPKDGTRVLLLKVPTGELNVARFLHGAYGPDWCTPDGYRVVGATHWTLPPAPPAEAAG